MISSSDRFRVIPKETKPYYEVVEVGMDDGGGFTIVQDEGKVVMAKLGGSTPRATHVRTVVTPPVNDKVTADLFCAALNARYENDQEDSFN